MEVNKNQKKSHKIQFGWNNWMELVGICWNYWNEKEEYIYIIYVNLYGIIWNHLELFSDCMDIYGMFHI